MTTPRGYREILVPHACGATVPFATWDGAAHLPMVVRCPRCDGEITHSQALAVEGRSPPTAGPGGEAPCPVCGGSGLGPVGTTTRIYCPKCSAPGRSPPTGGTT